jgi:hypothetical protein
LLLALIQFAIVVQHGTILDRYYFMVLAPVVPLLAALASRAPLRTSGRAWAVLTLFAGVALYAVGEQDYQAWQLARDQAAQRVYANHAVDDVNSGFEQIALHLGIPAMSDTTGSLPRGLRDRPSTSLLFAQVNDPRPGVTYSSVAPGKIVIQVNNDHAGSVP